MENISEYTKVRYRPGRQNSSVRNGFERCPRLDMAIEQSKLNRTPIDDIVSFTNEFLRILQMIPVSDPYYELENSNVVLYKEIERMYNLEDERDIVWMKFTDDGYLVVVATSNDVVFNSPLSKNDYNDDHDTSGIIVHYLGKKWNEKFILLFPLIRIPKYLNRKDIERGIGNYLVDKKVSILDFYSHNY